MIERNAAEEADGIGDAVRPQTGRRPSQLIIHAAEPQPESRTAASHQGFIVHIIIVHVVIRQHPPDAHPAAPAIHVIEIFLHSVAIAARGSITVIFHIENRALNLALLDAYRQIAGTEGAAGAEHPHRLRSRKAADPVKSRLQRSRFYDAPFLQPVQKSPSHIVL